MAPLMSRRELLLGIPLTVAGLSALRGAGAQSHAGGTTLQSLPFLAGEFGYSCFRTPGLAVSSSGVVLAFCGGRVDNCKDDGDHDIVLRRSFDGGRTWGPIQIISNDRRNRCDIPVPVVLPSGRILLLWVWSQFVARKKNRTERLVLVCHSDDGGATWSSARDITSQVRLPGWSPWYGIGPGHGFVKALGPDRGRIVIPARHGEPKIGSRSHLILSDDGGNTWYVGAQARGPYGSNEATACELGDGTILLNSRGNVNHRIITLIKNGGLTTVKTFVDYNLPEPKNGCQGSMLTYSTNRQLQEATLLFSNPTNQNTRADGRLRLSFNNGQTWSDGHPYGSSRNAFTGYSDIAKLANGDVGILFESESSAKDTQNYNQAVTTSNAKKRNHAKYAGLRYVRLSFEAITGK